MSIGYADIKDASFEQCQRAKTFECHEIGEWVAVGTEEGKDNRGVHFMRFRIECFSLEDGSQCPRNQYGKVCCHVVAADRRRLINKKFRETLQMRRAA